MNRIDTTAASPAPGQLKLSATRSLGRARTTATGGQS